MLAHLKNGKTNKNVKHRRSDFLKKIFIDYFKIRTVVSTKIATVALRFVIISIRIIITW